jgi:hypothetical protein
MLELEKIIAHCYKPVRLWRPVDYGQRKEDLE